LINFVHIKLSGVSHQLSAAESPDFP